jgi:protein-tyrosine phosphatase
MLVSDAVHIWRAPDGDYHIEWETTAPDTRVQVEALAADRAWETHYDITVLARARICGLAPARRHLFRLRDQHGNEVLAPERRLGLEGAPNFRDFGGYATAGGRRVRWGYLFRSGHLARLSERDLDLLESLELDLVCDFRQVPEQRREASRLPTRRPPALCSLPIEPGSASGLLQRLAGTLPGPETMVEFMLAVNRELAIEEAPVYRRMFEAILAQEEGRVLVHCAAGKDRTGFAAALILLALGVPEEAIMRDYLLSARFYDAEAEVERAKRQYGMTDAASASILPLLRVDERYLAAAFDAIAQYYPDRDTYLVDAIGLGSEEQAELRRRYLED